MLSLLDLVQTVLYPRSFGLFFNSSDSAPVTIAYGFANAGSFPSDYVIPNLPAGTLNSTNVTAFELDQIAAAEAVLNLISSYTCVTFVQETVSPAEAQIRFWNTSVFPCKWSPGRCQVLPFACVLRNYLFLLDYFYK